MDILQNNKPRAELQRGLTIEYISYILLLLYIFTMPFVSAFAFTGTISLPLIFAAVLFMLMIIKVLRTLKSPKGFLGFDILIILSFLFFDVLSFVINGWGNATSFNHTVAYLSTFLLFYVAIKFTLFSISDKNLLFKRILQFITYTTLLSAFYSNVEFISANFFDLNLNNYIPRPSEAQEFYDALAVSLFYRARGFAPESGHFAFMMELFSPLAIYYMYFSDFCKWRKLLKFVAIILIFLSFIFAVSTASFAIIPASVFMASLIYVKSIFSYIKRNLRKFILATVGASAGIFLFNYFFSVSALIILSISEKLDSTSLYDRQARTDFFYNIYSHLNLTQKVIGAGPAGVIVLGFDQFNAILNLYYSVTFELGIAGLILLLLFFSYIILKVIKIRTRFGFFLLISVISGVLHYWVIANFWYPWFWFIAAFTIFYSHFFSKEKGKI